MNATSTSRHTPVGERGSISVFAAVFSLAAVMLLGLVVDGAERLGSLARANATAAEAARAAADTVDLRGETAAIDSAAAVAAAREYLTRRGLTGTVTIPDARTVAVTVMLHGRYVVPLATGVDYEVTGRATATLGIGVETGNQ